MLKVESAIAMTTGQEENAISVSKYLMFSLKKLAFLAPLSLSLTLNDIVLIFMIFYENSYFYLILLSLQSIDLFSNLETEIGLSMVKIFVWIPRFIPLACAIDILLSNINIISILWQISVHVSKYTEIFRYVAQKIHISNIQTPSFYCRIIYTLKNDRN